MSRLPSLYGRFSILVLRSTRMNVSNLPLLISLVTAPQMSLSRWNKTGTSCTKTRNDSAGVTQREYYFHDEILHSATFLKIRYLNAFCTLTETVSVVFFRELQLHLFSFFFFCYSRYTITSWSLFKRHFGNKCYQVSVLSISAPVRTLFLSAREGRGAAYETGAHARRCRPAG